MIYKYAHLRFLKLGGVLLQTTRKFYSIGFTRIPEPDDCGWDLSLGFVYVMYRPAYWF